MFKAIKKVVSLFLPVDRQSETQDTNLKLPGELEPSSESLVKEAYNKVMNDIKASNKFKKQFLDALIENEKTGDGRRYFNKSVRPHLVHESWEWPEYDYFYKKFKDLNEWPFLWDKYLYKHPPKPKKSVEESLHLFNIKEIKQILNDHKLMPKPMPKIRNDYEKVLIQKANWELIEQLVIEKYEKELRYYEIKKKEAKLELLYGHLVRTFYGIRRYSEVQKTILCTTSTALEGKAVASHCKDGHSIDNEFVDKFNKGEISYPPPFFPGSVADIYFERKNQRRRQ